MTNDTKTKEACEECIKLITHNTLFAKRIVDLEKRLIEYQSCMEGVQSALRKYNLWGEDENE